MPLKHQMCIKPAEHSIEMLDPQMSTHAAGSQRLEALKYAPSPETQMCTKQEYSTDSNHQSFPSLDLDSSNFGNSQSNNGVSHMLLQSHIQMQIQEQVKAQVQAELKRLRMGTNIS